MNYAGTRGKPSTNFMTVTELPDNFDQMCAGTRPRPTFGQPSSVRPHDGSSPLVQASEWSTPTSPVTRRGNGTGLKKARPASEGIPAPRPSPRSYSRLLRRLLSCGPVCYSREGAGRLFNPITPADDSS
jgi:hypothetical protein